MQGLSGAGRSGNPREALFANPASVAFVNNVFGFAHYGLTRIPDLNAGGRLVNLGVYDGGNPAMKGGFAYIRNSRAVLVDGRQSYEDFHEYRAALGREVMKNVAFGVTGRYIGEHHGGNSVVHRFDGDAGVIFPLIESLRAGVTAENVLSRRDDQPFTLGVGLNYPIGYGAQLYADGSQVMKGSHKDNRGYALAAEMALAGDFTVRGGRFEEAYRSLKGWSLGLSWAGPRASFDYAIRFAGGSPRERDHVFGMTMGF